MERRGRENQTLKKGEWREKRERKTRGDEKEDRD